MKNLYIDTFFEKDIYKNFMDQFLLVDNISKTSLSEILVVFDNYLKNNNIDDKLVKQIENKQKYDSYIVFDDSNKLNYINLDNQDIDKTKKNLLQNLLITLIKLKRK